MIIFVACMQPGLGVRGSDLEAQGCGSMENLATMISISSFHAAIILYQLNFVRTQMPVHTQLSQMEQNYTFVQNGAAYNYYM